METLITGGTGLVGHHLVAALQQRGDTVRAIVLPSEDTSWLEERGVAVYRGNICDPDTLKAPMKGVDTGFLSWPPCRDYGCRWKSIIRSTSLAPRMSVGLL